MPSFYLISLGCPKNTVSSEKLIAAMEEQGYQIVEEAYKADFLLVNTCAFIKPAVEEAIEVILELVSLKKQNRKAKIVAMGCLPQRYRDNIRDLLPEVDLLWGVNQLEDIPRHLKTLTSPREFYPPALTSEPRERRLLTPEYSAYLKIAEGCDHTCNFCTIPKIKGPYLSRDKAELRQEAEILARRGVKELNLIAQDTTYYGMDLYHKKNLPSLLTELTKIKGIEWLRLLYTYPREITPELLSVMKNEAKLCPYLDMPLQHCSEKVLKAMGRSGNVSQTLELIERIRKAVPDVCLRSTLIVGHPGEGEKEFEELRDFLLQARVDKIGVFVYYREEGTPSASMKPQIPHREKQARRKILLETQQQISNAQNREKIGRLIPVLVEGEIQDFPTPQDPKMKKWLKQADHYGRTIYDAPQIDGSILLKGSCLPGEIRTAKILDSSVYDLLGEID